MRSLSAADPAKQKDAERCIATEIRTALYRELAAWFPRILDRRYGGFLCDFDAQWRATGPHKKFLEFQARVTRAATECALFDPSLAQIRAAAEHGFRFLRDVMWDAKNGGWYTLVDQTGVPLRGGTKHGHGAAYAIQACVMHYRLTGDSASLALAQEGLAWLETHAHDRTHGGYHGFYKADGTPILSATDTPFSHPMGIPAGAKDINTNIDMLDALAYMYAVAPQPLLRQRLLEQVELTRGLIVTANGFAYKAWTRDWNRLTQIANFGYMLQLSPQYHAAAMLVWTAGSKDVFRQFIQQLLDTALRHGWDQRNGGFYTSARVGPDSKVAIVDARKFWWQQAEGLRALLAFAEFFPEERERYLRYFYKQWDYIQTNIIDHVHGGWRFAGLDTARTATHKSDAWKDPNHELRALRECIDLMNRLDLAQCAVEG